MPSTHPPIDAGVRIGHVHLKVADLERSLAFYCGVLGFQLMQRFGLQAAFISAGGYHHHIGLNTWESLGGKPAEPGATGLYHVAILIPPAHRWPTLRRLRHAKSRSTAHPRPWRERGAHLRDPDEQRRGTHRDRPRTMAPVAGRRRMDTTHPLDLAGLLRRTGAGINSLLFSFTASFSGAGLLSSHFTPGPACRNPLAAYHSSLTTLPGLHPMKTSPLNAFTTALLSLLFLTVTLTADPPVTGGITADEAMARLEAGNRRFCAGQSLHPQQQAERREETATQGQHPFAIVLSCSDSRVPPELLFDQGIGDLFVVRVAGNVAATDEIATIEYGAEHLGAQLCVVMGHSRCGAVTAVINGDHAHAEYS